jgi:hypothetical protein
MQTVNLDKLPPQARLELLDFYEFLLGKYASSEVFKDKAKNGWNTQPRLGELATRLFGATNGVELHLPRHPPHEPLEFGQ